jgi:hypothetical protein
MKNDTLLESQISASNLTIKKASSPFGEDAFCKIQFNYFFAAGFTG